MFHADAATPTWGWLPVEYAEMQEMEIVAFRHFYQYGPQKDCPGLEEVFLNPQVGGSERGYNIVFAYDDSMYINYNTTQQNMAAKKATNGKWKQEWRGPLIAFRQDTDPKTGLTTKAANMGMSDFSELVSYLINGREKREDGLTRQDLEAYGFKNFSLG
jgi:hypothetical protein